MKYQYTEVDQDNLKWFAHDCTVASLTAINLKIGTLRGLHKFDIEFTYPISVIAGKNRSGKSTLLAMAACAFHNKKDGFTLPERKIAYYTFSDFFIQSSEEIPLEGILITYRILYNHWAKSEKSPDGIGNFFQSRHKQEGGKWNNYDRRVPRNVIFFGVHRVVPHSERSISKSYKSYFIDQKPAGWESQVKDIVGRILGTTYNKYKIKAHGKYQLPLVYTEKYCYSGLNMGAGENALFDIFSKIFSTPKGTLLVIDEIELGLHVDAQRRLLQELKEICRQRRIQVICTTHSPTILEAVPPEARFYIDNFAEKTIITCGISPQYAAGKLSEENSNELDVYVEDDVAANLIRSFMHNSNRKRVNMIPIGSASAVVRQMAARYKDPKQSESIAILDGDQANQINQHKDLFLKMLESIEDGEKEPIWFMERIAFLPGNTWPEKWLIQTLRSIDICELAKRLNVSEAEFLSYVDEANSASKHCELDTLANKLSLDSVSLCNISGRWLKEIGNSDISPINEIFEKYLI